MNVHFLPGLGFDRRIFQGLDLPGHRLHYHDWIEPEPGEAMRDYVRRMVGAGSVKGADQILVGHSLGGIAAQEYAAQFDVRKVILLSSIKSRAEMPGFFKAIQPLGIHHLFKKGWTVRTVPYWGKRHGYETPTEIALFRDMVGRQSNRYLKWALRTLSVWKAPQLDPQLPVVQIHGAEDRTFPVKRLQQPDLVLPNKGHFMVYRYPDLVGAALREHLN